MFNVLVLQNAVLLLQTVELLKWNNFVRMTLSDVLTAGSEQWAPKASSRFLVSDYWHVAEMSGWNTCWESQLVYKKPLHFSQQEEAIGPVQTLVAASPISKFPSTYGWVQTHIFPLFLLVWLPWLQHRVPGCCRYSRWYPEQSCSWVWGCCAPLRMADCTPAVSEAIQKSLTYLPAGNWSAWEA